MEWRRSIRLPDYDISERGDLKLATRDIFSFKVGYVRKPNVHSNGYLVVTDRRADERLYIHHLVAEAFIGPRPVGALVLHGDGDKLNNHRSNLRYGTQLENIADARSHGTLTCGERMGSAKLRAADVLRIREAHLFGAKAGDLAEAYGVTSRPIRAVINRETWKHVS